VASSCEQGSSGFIRVESASIVTAAEQLLTTQGASQFVNNILLSSIYFEQKDVAH
jgi:hypothetical protein